MNLTVAEPVGSVFHAEGVVVLTKEAGIDPDALANMINEFNLAITGGREHIAGAA